MSTVAILGASANPDRFSFKALHQLRNAGHTVIPVNPALESIDGTPVVKSLADVPGADTLTLYVGPDRLAGLHEEIVRLKPGRVIFNPGTESPELQSALDAAGIPWVEDCTLVMLQAGRFCPGNPPA